MSLSQGLYFVTTTASESSLRDYRCMITGVGLLDTECGCVLLAEKDSGFIPVTLPLWGRYAGHGTLEEISDGPGSDLVLGGIQELQRSGRLNIDWQALGVEPRPLDHIEAVISVLALGHIHRQGAIQCDKRTLSLAIFSAHVAAALMDQEPSGLPQDTPIERLPEVVFRGDPIAQTLYGPLAAQSVRLRCRFGLILAGFRALEEGFKARQIQWAAPSEAPPVDSAASERWLAHALARAGDDPILLAGLSEHLSSGSEEDEEVETTE